MTQATSPISLPQAIQILGEDPDCIPIAGCTDLMVAATESESFRDRRVLDLLGIPEIHGIKSEGEGWRIGATTTFSEIARSRRMHSLYPALTAAASEIGGWQIQNRATIGGNIANASPAGDSLPVLLVLDAVIVAAGPEGEREIPYREFHVAYRKTALRPGEIIGWIRLPPRPKRDIQLFRKVGTRRAQAISKVVVAMAAELEVDRLFRVRFGAGSVAATPIRLEATEKVCEGTVPDHEMADRVEEAAAGEVEPIDDVRSTAAYRRYVLGRVVRRMILQAGGYS